MRLGNTIIHLVVKTASVDIAGNDRYRARNRNSNPGSHAVVFVYDDSCHTSFDNLMKEDVCGMSNPALMYLVGNSGNANKIAYMNERKKNNHRTSVETSPETGQNEEFVSLNIFERPLQKNKQESVCVKDVNVKPTKDNNHRWKTSSVTPRDEEQTVNSMEADKIAYLNGYNNFVQICAESGENVDYLLLDILERLLQKSKEESVCEKDVNLKPNKRSNHR